MKKLLILCSILLIVGCGGGQWVAVQTFDAVPRPEPKVMLLQSYDKNYKIGEIRTAFVGQEIIKVRPYKQKISYSYFYEKNASSDNPVYIEVLDRYNYRVRSDAKNYLITQSIGIKDKKYDIIKLFANDSNVLGLLIDDKGRIFRSGLYSYDHKMMYYPEFITILPEKFNISLRKIKGPEEVVEIKGIPFELIYSGKNDVSLNATYREYTPDDIARSAFFQDITYRADAKNIRFKDFEIQIHDASNEKITYTVLEDRLESGPVN